MKRIKDIKWKLRLYHLVLLAIMIGLMILSKFTNVGAPIVFWIVIPIIFCIVGFNTRGYNDNFWINFIIFAGAYILASTMYDSVYMTMVTLYFVMMGLVYVVLSVLITMGKE